MNKVYHVIKKLSAPGRPLPTRPANIHFIFQFDVKLSTCLRNGMLSPSIRPSVFNTLLLLIVLTVHPLTAAPTADGLYARIQTSEGVFFAKLHFDKVPLTVANFVGLVEGSRAWLDFSTGAASNAPFYNGLLIPRAVPGFVIQMGSPTNTLSGSPGYQFSDEFYPDLKHDSAGVLSMANSGRDTNDCQFFITLDSTNSLDHKHSVFGNVVEGIGVVMAIGNLPASSVTIEQISMLRIGVAATSFNSTEWRLPEIRSAAINQVTVDKANDSYGLDFDRTTFSKYIVSHSSNLQSWSQINSSTLTHLESTTPTTLDVSTVSAGQDKQFFRAAIATYTSVPNTLNGLTINLNLIGSNETLNFTITEEPRDYIDYADPLGTFVLNEADSGAVGGYFWTQALPRGRLGLVIEGFDPLYFSLKFHLDGTGIFAGSTSSSRSDPSPFYGEFTWQVTP